jgi:hypothetical protein
MAVSVNVLLSVSVGDEVATSIGSTNAFSGIIADSFGLTNPAVDTVYIERIALSAGAATINLTALVRSGRTNLDMTGKTVYGYAVRNNGANSMTFVAAASNGYPLVPATTPTTLGVGGFWYEKRPTGFGVVGPTLRDITVAGTTTQNFDIAIWAGIAA